MPLYGPPGERIGYALYEHPGEAPPLLLLHGFTASSAAWLAAIHDLRKHFTVITADLLGHGESDAPEDPALYEPAAAVARLVGLLDELEYDEALVCGHSLGGALAVRMALDTPARVAGLVVVNSNSAAGTAEWRAEVQPQLAEMAARVRSEGTDFLRQTRLYPARSRRLPDAAREALTADFDRLTSAGVAGTALGLTAKVNAFERLGELSVPVLIVAGDRDLDFVHGAPRLVAAIRRAPVQMATIPGAGHNVQLEEPDAFNHELVAFARQVAYLPPPTFAQRYRRPFLMGAGFVIGWIAIGWGAYTLVSSGANANAQPTTTVRAAATGQPASTATAPAPSPMPQPTRTATPTAPPTLAPTATVVPTTATPPVPTPTPALQPTQQPQTAQPTPTPVRPTATPTETPTPTPTETPTPTPTPETPTATPTPAGPRVTISGPATAEAGAPATFMAQPSGPGLLRVEMSSVGGSRKDSVLVVTFPVPGCYTVTATAFFATGAVTGSTTVAVGGAACN